MTIDILLLALYEGEGGICMKTKDNYRIVCFSWKTSKKIELE